MSKAQEIYKAALRRPDIADEAGRLQAELQRLIKDHERTFDKLIRLHTDIYAMFRTKSMYNNPDLEKILKYLKERIDRATDGGEEMRHGMANVASALLDIDKVSDRLY